MWEAAKFSWALRSSFLSRVAFFGQHPLLPCWCIIVGGWRNEGVLFFSFPLNVQINSCNMDTIRCFKKPIIKNWFWVDLWMPFTKFWRAFTVQQWIMLLCESCLKVSSGEENPPIKKPHYLTLQSGQMYNQNLLGSRPYFFYFVLFLLLWDTQPDIG